MASALSLARKTRRPKIWDVETGHELLVPDHTNSVRSAAFSPDGKYLVAGVGWYGDRHVGEVKVWDATMGQLRFTLQNPGTLKGHTGHVRCVAFSPDGQRIATGSDDLTARLWESSTGQEVIAFKGHTAVVRSVAFSPDRQHLLTGDKAGRTTG